MMCFTRLVAVALILAAAGTVFAGSNPSFKNPAGSKQTTVSATTGRTVEQGSVNGDGRRLILPVDTPAVKVNLFGREYSVKERRVCLPVRIVEKQDQGVNAFWDPSKKEIVLTQQDYVSYMRKLEEGDGDGAVMDIVRHEAIHASVSQEYGRLYEDENGRLKSETSDWYHFLQEMLAYVGGDGLSKESAAEKIIKSRKSYYLGDAAFWRNEKVYPEGARVIAEKFLNGEPYTPPEAALNTKDQGDSPKPVSVDDLKKMDLDDKNGDWCHCENPQCIKRINRDATGKLLSHCVGFECAKCRKINVEHAKLALSIHQEALDQGLRPQWQGLNAEANAKAAGNAK